MICALLDAPLKDEAVPHHIEVHINLQTLETRSCQVARAGFRFYSAFTVEDYASGWRQTLQVQADDFSEHDLPTEITMLRESPRCYWADLLSDRTIARIDAIAELHRHPEPKSAADGVIRSINAARSE